MNQIGLIKNALQVIFLSLSEVVKKSLCICATGCMMEKPDFQLILRTFNSRRSNTILENCDQTAILDINHWLSQTVHILKF